MRLVAGLAGEPEVTRVISAFAGSFRLMAS
jgi:hypothetical protein